MGLMIRRLFLKFGGWRIGKQDKHDSPANEGEAMGRNDAPRDGAMNPHVVSLKLHDRCPDGKRRLLTLLMGLDIEARGRES